MNKSLKDMIAECSESEQQAIRERTQELLAEESVLQELRKKLDLTQEDVALRLGKAQHQISKIECSQDLKLSTLREFIEDGLGGQLQLIVKFPDQNDIEISNLGKH